MATDKKQIILVVVPTIAVVVLITITSIAIIRKLRLRSRRNLLPVTETSGLAEQHIGALQNWQKPTNSSTSTNNPWPTIKSDPSHRLFLAEPAASHQPQRPAKGTWQQFKEKQRQREQQAQTVSRPAQPWNHAPKGAAYWGRVGKEMQARKPWWEKVQDRLGM
jgi:hypothetical protein